MPYSQFADIAQIPRPTLSQILSGRNKKISNEVITKLHEAFPQLSVMWLMFGDGSMLVDGTTITPVNASPTPSGAPERAPYSADKSPDMGLFDMEPDDDSVQAPVGASKPAVDKTTAPASVTVDAGKQVAYIMVFYSDSSYQMFTPSNK